MTERNLAAEPGRPGFAWTPENTTRLIDLIASGTTVREAQRQIGCTNAAYHHRRERDDIFALACKGALLTARERRGPSERAQKKARRTARVERWAAARASETPSMPVCAPPAPLPAFHPASLAAPALTDAQTATIVEQLAARVQAQPTPNSPVAREALLARLAVLRARLHEAEYFELKREKERAEKERQPELF